MKQFSAYFAAKIKVNIYGYIVFMRCNFSIPTGHI